MTMEGTPVTKTMTTTLTPTPTTPEMPPPVVPWEETSANAPAPVVFRSLSSIPNVKVETPSEEIDLVYTKIAYFRPTTGTTAATPSGAANFTGNSGYFELSKISMPSINLRLYPSSMKALVKHLEDAARAAVELEAHPEMHDDDATFDVCTINNFGNMSTRLVMNTFRGEVFINLKLFTTNLETKQMFPTRKGVRFSINDNLATLSAFVQGKK